MLLGIRSKDLGIPTYPGNQARSRRVFSNTKSFLWTDEDRGAELITQLLEGYDQRSPAFVYFLMPKTTAKQKALFAQKHEAERPRLTIWMRQPVTARPKSPNRRPLTPPRLVAERENEPSPPSHDPITPLQFQLQPSLPDGDILRDASLLILGNALSNPHNVPEGGGERSGVTYSRFGTNAHEVQTPRCVFVSQRDQTK